MQDSWKNLAVGLIVSIGVAAHAGIAEAQTKVRQAGCLVIDMSVPFLAKEKGFFAQNGLDWEYFGSECGRLAVAALVSGNVEFADMGMDGIVRLREQDQNLVGVYSMVNSLTMDLVVRNDALSKANLTATMSLEQKLQGLKGLKFGISRPGSAGHTFAEYLVKKGGLDPQKDVTFVQVGGGSALVAAIKEGHIDAFLLSAPAPYLVERDNVGTVLVKNSAGEGPEELKDFAFETIATRKDYAEQNPEVVEAYCRSLNQAYEWMVANKAEAVELLKTYFPDTDEETLRISFEALVPAIIPGGKLSANAVGNYIKVMKELGSIKSSPDPSEGVLWTNKYNKGA